MRGKVITGASPLRLTGITPAYAGKSTSLSATRWPKKDHPRVCGEKSSYRLKALPAAGSPPRMRGKVVRLCMATGLRRITPAYAGKRLPLQDYSLACWDHPRVCGEKCVKAQEVKTTKGSPPRVRGKVDFYYFYTPNRRITPACAGKRTGRLMGKPLPGDHPRVCGEKADCHVPQCTHLGSPPRMRGKVVVSRNLCLFSGITPAYAGKSEVSKYASKPAEDHPRVCGEKANAKRERHAALGSPPRMRGKAARPRAAPERPGITPAYAGKRSAVHTWDTRPWDHPRVCGEKLLCCMRWLTGRGSPPRMRGKDLLVATPGQKQPGSPPRMRGKAEAGLVQRELPGITPAYAGKSALAIDE